MTQRDISHNGSKRRRRCPVPVVPLCAWPERDLRAWHATREPASLLEGRPSLAHLAPDALQRIVEGYGRWLGYLQATGVVADRGSGLDNLDHNNLAGFVDLLNRNLASCTVRAYVTALHTAVRHMDPHQDHESLRRMLRICQRRARPESIKAPRVVAASALYDLGFKMMERAGLSRQHGAEIPLRALQGYRDGLMIAMLIARPIRIGNFAALEIDRHLFRLHQGYRLVLDAGEVKNRHVYELDLPQELTGAIDRYLEFCRPQLLARSGRWVRAHEGTALWISRDGAPYRPRALRERITKLTRQEFGHAINPHLFRDCAATSIATELPEHVRIIAPILGHTNLQSGERYYNQARSLQAGRRYQDVIADLRGERP